MSFKIDGLHGLKVRGVAACPYCGFANQRLWSNVVTDGCGNWTITVCDYEAGGCEKEFAHRVVVNGNYHFNAIPMKTEVRPLGEKVKEKPPAPWTIVSGTGGKQNIRLPWVEDED